MSIVGATLSSPPGGWTFILKPKLFILLALRNKLQKLQYDSVSSVHLKIVAIVILNTVVLFICHKSVIDTFWFYFRNHLISGSILKIYCFSIHTCTHAWTLTWMYACTHASTHVLQGGRLFWTATYKVVTRKASYRQQSVLISPFLINFFVWEWSHFQMQIRLMNAQL